MRDEEILALLRARDERGVEALLRQYGALLRYVIAPILPDGLDREECLASCTMRVWEKIGDYAPGRGSLRAWLTAIARNAALNMARSRRDDAPLTPEIPSPADTPEEALLRRERQQALARALAALPQRDRAIFYRKYYYLQSTAQIAAETGLSERAVEGRLYRLRQRLRAELGGDGDA